MLIPKVLIVNDDPNSIVALKGVLSAAVERKELQIITAHSGEEALRQIMRHEFAVVLLDVSMPTMDGFETAEAIHSSTRHASLPIIFVTAFYADELHRLEGYDKGAVDYVFMPVNPQVLQTKVSVFVELARQRLELQVKTDELNRLNQDLRVQRLQDLERHNAELQAEVADRKEAERRAYDMSIRDPLTGLLNRRPLMEHLEHAVSYSVRHDETFALLFIDLDKFKSVNDRYGHDAGDELLIQIAQALQQAVRLSDIVARLGGDEFVVLVKAISGEDEAMQIGDKIAQSLDRTYQLGAHEVAMSASIGLAVYPKDGSSAQQLMKAADTAMYTGKQEKDLLPMN